MEYEHIPFLRTNSNTEIDLKLSFVSQMLLLKKYCTAYCVCTTLSAVVWTNRGRPNYLSWHEVSHITFSPSRQRNYTIKDIITPISKHNAIKTFQVESVVQLLILWMSVLERNKWWVFMLQSLYSPPKKSFPGIIWSGCWMQTSIILGIVTKIELLPSWESVLHPPVIVSNILGFTEYLTVDQTFLHVLSISLIIILSFRHEVKSFLSTFHTFLRPLIALYSGTNKLT